MDIYPDKKTGKEISSQYFPLLNRIEFNNKFISNESDLKKVFYMKSNIRYKKLKSLTVVLQDKKGCV